MIHLVAPAKLTTSLRVVGVRDDGFHLIDAEMVELDFCDELSVDPTSTGFVWSANSDVGEPTDLDPANNLIVRALELAGRTAYVELFKRIPAGAGLGGGSADAAAILRWAEFTDLEAAAALGADIAFCLVGGRARVRGIGEIVEPVAAIDSTFTLVTPDVHCSTPAVYQRWDEMGGPSGEQGNDLEPAALSVAPELATTRDALQDATGQTPRLAGSGSSWFVEGAYPDAGRVVRSFSR